MTTDLIALAKQALTPDLIGKAAALLGEDSSRTGALAAGAVPMLLAAMGSGASPAGFAGFAKAAAAGGSADPAMLGNLSALLASSGAAAPLLKAGEGLLGDMFGAQSGLMATALAAFAGTKASSATSMMSLLVPLLGGLMGKSLVDAGKEPTLANMQALLHDNKRGILAALPPRLAKGLASIPGLGALLGLPAAAAGYRRFLPWLLLLLAFLLLLLWLLGRDKVDVATCNAQFKQALAGKTINFDTGDASIAADSKALLAELATVANRCKAYRIEVAGHTDTVGDPAMNKDLSQRRAAVVSRYLQSQGVPASQLSAVGYGAERPAVVTGDETAMAANRRIEITVSE